MKKWLMGIVGLAASAALVAGSAVADDNTKVNFDQGVDVHGVVQSLGKDGQAEALGTLSSARTLKTPVKKTYTVSRGGVHAKGFTPHKDAKRDYKTYSDLQAEGISKPIPNAMDLRPQLTQIEDQGQCGSCWAFSLTATNRDGHAIDGKDPGRLSQEWLVDNSKEAAGCNGGDFDSANDFIQPAGEPLWSACPYAEGNGGCAATLPPAASIAGWHMLGDATNGPSVRDIEAYIASTGKPVSIAIAAAAGDWENYSGGIYNGCTSGQLDHMINIVGWDNQGAAFDANGNLPPGKGIWILRNSWGTSWGEKGYMRTQMTDSTGARCNNVAEQAAYFDFAAPPTPKTASAAAGTDAGGR